MEVCPSNISSGYFLYYLKVHPLHTSHYWDWGSRSGVSMCRGAGLPKWQCVEGGGYGRCKNKLNKFNKIKINTDIHNTCRKSRDCNSCSRQLSTHELSCEQCV